MSSTGTKRSRNRGTSKPSSENQTCKNSLCKGEKISKYFSKVAKSSGTDDSSLSDSPYKNCLKEVVSVDLNNSSDLDDFKTPKAINKVSKIANEKPAARNVKKKKTRQLPLRKFVEDNLKHSDVNPEHLQMALALSESSYEAENPGSIQSSQEKRDSFKEAFKKFGFGYSKSKIPVEVKREESVKKVNKKSRYRFVTPILKICTHEEREALIASKLSLILQQNSRKPESNVVLEGPELFCESLQKCKNERIYKLNRLELSELNENNRLCVPHLAIEACSVLGGRLLKDWKKIPGRDPTPERERTYHDKTLNLTPPNHVSTFCLTPPTKVNCENHEDFSGRVQVETLNLTPPNHPSTSTNDVICLVEEESCYIFDDQSANQETLFQNSRLTPPIVGPPINRDVTTVDFPFKQANISGGNSTKIEDNKMSPLGEKTIEYSYTDDIDFENVKVQSDVNLKYELSPEVKSPSSISPVWRNSRGTLSSNKINSPPMENSLNVDEFDREGFTQNFVTPPPSRKLSPPRPLKRPYECVSPDLFDSDDEQPSKLSNNKSQNLNRLRGGQDLNLEEIECYDLTQSDEEQCFPEDSIGQRSDLNVTDYVQDLLSNYKEAPPTKKFEQVSTSEDDSQPSQNSVVISDDELNYSSVFSANPKKYDFSDDEELLGSLDVSLAQRIKNKSKKDELSQKEEDVSSNYHEMYNTGNSSHETPQSLIPTLEDSFNEIFTNAPHTAASSTSLAINTKNVTPVEEDLSSDDHMPQPVMPILEDSLTALLTNVPQTDTPPTSLVIKTKNVTPMANYDDMDTPRVVKELDKFGLKPLKRQKGAKLLKYIYESTHPVVNQAVKKTPTWIPPVGDVPEGDLIFEKKQSKRVASCAVPLHIVWHNFVMSNPKIRENILLYEPLQLEVLHSMLKDQGFKFNIQDLLTFLDKKCITVRTAQGQRHKGRK